MEMWITDVELRPDGLISALCPPRLWGSMGAAGPVCSLLVQECLGTLSWHPGMLLGLARGCGASTGLQLQSCFGKRNTEPEFPTISRCMICVNKQTMSSSKVFLATVCSFSDR